MYATAQDLIDRFGLEELVRLTNPTDRTATAIDSARLDQALADAKAVIEASLAGRYELPLASKPEILTRIACDLARYFLFDGANQRPTEQATKRYDDAIAYLTKVSTGAINLSLAQDQTAPPVSAGAPSFTGEPRTFTTDTLRDWQDPPTL